MFEKKKPSLLWERNKKNFPLKIITKFDVKQHNRFRLKITLKSCRSIHLAAKILCCAGIL